MHFLFDYTPRGSFSRLLQTAQTRLYHQWQVRFSGSCCWKWCGVSTKELCFTSSLFALEKAGVRVETPPFALSRFVCEPLSSSLRTVCAVLS